MRIVVSTARSHIDSVTSLHVDTVDTVGHSLPECDGPEMLIYGVTKHSA